MLRMRGAAALLVLAGLALAGCRDRPPAPGGTSVLGGNGPAAAASGEALTDARGQPIPAPPVAPGTPAQVVRAGDDTALAVWVKDGHVTASSFARPRGWSEPRALEEIYGVASDPQLASNGRGAAMALWRHTVGTIQSLRFSRFDAASGWSAPDVVPGALPRPRAEGAAGVDVSPRLAMDADGTVTARWPSGFASREQQVARYTPRDGWSPAASEPVVSAQDAASAPGAPAAR